MLGFPAMKTTNPGYISSKKPLLNRIRRIEGQLGGIERMIEEERYCIDVLTQINAAQAALDKVALELLDDHTKSCVIDAKGTERPERAEELMGAVARLMRRG
jgi:CsoR family transcriptional regulator, copper-sensing transcriptional repressor